MKRQFFLLAIVLLGLSTGIFAQNPRKEIRRSPLGGLSIDERSRLQSAHEAALRDPELMASRMRFQQARDQYRNQLRAGMLRADPAVQPILEKVHRPPPRDRH